MDGPARRRPAVAVRALVDPPWRADALIAGLLLANEVPWGSLESATGAWHAAGAAVQCLLVLARRRRPLAVLAGVAVLAAVLAVAGATPADDLSVPGLVAAYSAAVFHRAAPAPAAAVAGGAAAALLVPIGAVAGRWGAAAGLGAVLGVVVALGLAVRARRSDRERLAARADALEAERERLARDVHDVVAQSMSVVAVQAAAVRAGAGAAAGPVPGSGQGGGVVRGADADPRLAVIDEAARDALAGMTRIVSGLRSPLRAAAEPAGPSLADVADLVERFRAAGQDVDLAGPGPGDASAAEVPPGVQALAYRAVREGLGNALVHAPGAAVAVGVEVLPAAGGARPRRRPGAPRAAGMRVEVRNGAPEPPPGRDPLPRGGTGLADLRAQAAALGGGVEAGPSGAGFSLVLLVPPRPGRGA